MRHCRWYVVSKSLLSRPVESYIDGEAPVKKELPPLPPGVGGEVNRLDANGDERDESEMLLFPLTALLLPCPRLEDLEPLGVEGACLLELDGDEGGGVPDLFAFASNAAFWLFRPNGDSAAADGRLGAGEGMLVCLL